MSVASPQIAVPGSRSSITIGCFASLCRERLSEHLVAFAAAEPGVTIGVRELGLAALELALEGGELDLAITPAPLRPTECSIALWRDRVAIAVASSDPLADFDRVPVDRIGGATLLVARHGDDGGLHRFFCERVLSGVAVKARLHDGDLSALMPRVAAADGYALVAEGSAIACTGIAIRPIGGAQAVFQVNAIWRPTAAGSTLDRFCQQLRGSAS